MQSWLLVVDARGWWHCIPGSGCCRGTLCVAIAAVTDATFGKNMPISGVIFRFDTMSDLLRFNSHLAFADDDTIPQISFEREASFIDSCVIPETPLPSGGAAARDMSVHDMLRDAGIQLHASQTSVIVPPTQLTAGSQLASDIPAMYPHCVRQFSEDFESSLLVNWHLCTAGQIYDILSSPHMMCGRAQSMAYPMKFAIGILTSELAWFCPTDSKVLKDMTSKSIKNGPALRTAFENCCSGTGVLESLKRTLTKYTQNKANVVKWKPGIVPEEKPNLLDQLRLASIMIDPRFDSFFVRSFIILCVHHMYTGAWTCSVAWQILVRTKLLSNFPSSEFKLSNSSSCNF